MRDLKSEVKVDVRNRVNPKKIIGKWIWSPQDEAAPEAISTYWP